MSTSRLTPRFPRFHRLSAILAAGALALIVALPAAAEESGSSASKKDEGKSETGKAQDARKSATDSTKPQAEPTLASVAAAAAERRREAAAAEDVITTEDLDRRFGAGGMGGVYQASPDAAATPVPGVATDGGAPVPPLPDAGDPLMALQQQQADAAERSRALEAAEAEVVALRARMEELERRALAIANPFLPRPKVDKDDEAAENWDKEDAAERRAKTQEEIAAVKEHLAAAERRLADLRSGRVSP